MEVQYCSCWVCILGHVPDEEHGSSSLVDAEEPLAVKRGRLEHFLGQVPAALKRAEAAAAAATADAAAAVNTRV